MPAGNVIVPAGTKVMGIIADSKSAGRVVGKSELEIAFTDLQINGVLFPIQSQGVKAVGEGSGRDTARKVGAAALVGGAFGGGSGAAKGAAIGGAAAMLTRGKEIRIPSGTVLELSLVAPARVPAPPAPAPVVTTTVTVAPAAAAAPAPGSGFCAVRSREQGVREKADGQRLLCRRGPERLQQEEQVAEKLQRVSD